MKADEVLKLAYERKLHPVLIVEGGNSEKRFLLAVEIAKLLLCGCNSCSVCNRASKIKYGEDSLLPDLRLLYKEGVRDTTVDSVREFLSTVELAPYEARSKVYIFVDGDTLNYSSQNSMLKVLEENFESPRYFIILASNKRFLLPTVLSRSLKVSLGEKERDENFITILEEKIYSLFREFYKKGDLYYLLAMGETISSALEEKERIDDVLIILNSLVSKSDIKGVECEFISDFAFLLLEFWGLRKMGIRPKKIVNYSLLRAYKRYLLLK